MIKGQRSCYIFSANPLPELIEIIPFLPSSKFYFWSKMWVQRLFGQKKLVGSKSLIQKIVDPKYKIEKTYGPL